jgi:phosphoglycerate dehydrogenase-like enzyme
MSASGRKKALVTAEFTDQGIDRLSALGYDVSRAGWGVTHRTLDQAQLLKALDRVEVLICELETVDDTILAAASDLRLIGACRGDPVNVDLNAATRRGVIVLHTPTRNAASVADFTLGLVLTELRGIARGQAHLRGVGWNVNGELPYLHFRGPELAGQTLGVIGYGAVGREVAARAHGGFGMRVMAYDPYVTKVESHVQQAELADLLKAADVASIHCTLTPETEGLIGEGELSLLGPRGYLVNTARAPVVQEQALIAALTNRTIAGAALDVFWKEPILRDHPLLKLPNVTVTPHLAGAADDVKRHHTEMIVSDVARWLAGTRPQRLANPDVWRLQAS